MNKISSTSTFNINEYKLNTKINWNTVAPIYHKNWANTYTGPFKSTIELVKSADIHQEENILDLACGTGAVLNEIVKTIDRNSIKDDKNTKGILIGIDISRVALSIAKTSIRSRVRSLLIEIDAENLGFRKSFFNKILCQFGLMFFPNALSVLKDLKEILAENGKLIVSVHGSENNVPYFSCIMKSIIKYIPDIRPKETPSVHIFGDPTNFYNILNEAKFCNIQIEKYTFNYNASTFEDYWSDYMSSTANSIRDVIKSKGNDIFNNIKKESEENTKKYTNSQGLINFPWEILIATAYKNK